MKRLLIAILLALVIPACHNVTVPAPAVGPPAPPSGPPLTQVVLQATNQDPYDYALWIEWEDAAGAISVQSYLFSVFGDPFCGPTTNFVIVQADPSISYTILLADPWGTVYDTYQLFLPTATSVDVSFNIVDGYLYRTIP